MSVRARVMIVDDEVHHLELMAALFRGSAIEAEAFSSGEAALAAVQSGRQYHLVLADVVMPGMTGLELAKSIHASNPEIPVVLVTGHDSAIRAAEEGGRLALVKPYTPQMVNAVLTEHLGFGI